MSFYVIIMANFDMMDDEEYRELFITQTPRQDIVSLEENSDFQTVLDPKFSDILDDEEDVIEKQMRYDVWF